jgi:transketolase
MTELGHIARQIRRDLIHMAHRARSPHIGSALSCVDILTALYFQHLKLEPWEQRDIFILSKAHAAMGLYAALARKGIISRETAASYYLDGGELPSHLDRETARGIEISTGALGHGFSMGLGMAYGFQIDGHSRRVFALIGDGESQEGCIWEGALFAPRLGLSNFTAIVDYNNLQGYGRPRDICSLEPFVDKWQAFGWHCQTVDGHDQSALLEALQADGGDKPKVVLAKTIKGKGVSFMEDELIWHYYVVTDELREKALKELACEITSQTKS